MEYAIETIAIAVENKIFERTGDTVQILKGKESIYEQIKELKINADKIEEIPNICI